MIAPALLTMLVTQAAVVAAFLAIPVVAPQVAAAIGVSPETVGYYTSVVFIGAIVAAQFAPRFIARVGSVRASQITCLFAAAGVALASLGTTVSVFVGAVLIGLAYAPGNPASSALLARVTPPARRGVVFSLKQTAVPIGAALAGLILPGVATFAGWRAALMAAAAIALAIALAVQPWRRELDVTRNEAGKPRGAQPAMVVASDPQLRRAAAIAGAFAGIQFSTSAILVAFLVDSVEVSLPAAGAALTAAMLASVMLRILLGHAADRFGSMAVLLAIAGLMTAMIAACAAFALVPGAAPAAAVVAAAVVLATSSFSWNGVYLAHVASIAPADAVGSATAGAMTFVFLGGVLGPAAFSAAAISVDSYAGGFAVQLALAATLLLALTWPRSRAHDRETDRPGESTISEN